MAVRVISTSLPKDLTVQIQTFLSHDYTLEELRQVLCATTQDRWVCISGSNFSYVVS